MMRTSRGHKQVRRHFGYLCGFSLFLAGTFWSLNRLGRLGVSLDLFAALPIPLVVLPAFVFLSLLRFGLVGELCGANFSYRRSFEVVALGKLANMLPVPGGAFVRWEALRRKVGKKQSFVANVAATGIWFAAECLVLGVCVAITQEGWYVSSVALGVFISSFICSYYLLGRGECRVSVAKPLLLVQIGLTVANVVSLWSICRVLQLTVSPDFPASLSLANFFGVTVGVAPSGIGIAEGMAAMMASFINEMPQLAFICLAINRVLIWIAFGVAVLFFGTLNLKDRPENESE